MEDDVTFPEELLLDAKQKLVETTKSPADGEDQQLAFRALFQVMEVLRLLKRNGKWKRNADDFFNTFYEEAEALLGQGKRMPEQTDQKPKDFREVSEASMEASIAQCERRLAAGDDRHAALAELYNWGWIHEWRSHSDVLYGTIQKALDDNRALSAAADEVNRRFNERMAKFREQK